MTNNKKKKKKHKKKAEWINNITRGLEGLEKGPKVEIHIDLLKMTLEISNRKTPSHDGTHGNWFKKFTSIHDRLALEMNRCLQGAHILKLMIKGKNHTDPEGPSKGTAPNNYGPITSLPIMRKILIAEIRKELCNSLTSRGLFPDEQKGCCKGWLTPPNRTR